MKKVRLGVLGCSDFFRNKIIPAVRQTTNSEIISLASRDILKAKAWSESLHIPYHDSYDSLIKRNDIDAIYIPLPVGLHKEWVIKCALAGKDILCEKSLGDNLHDVQEMVRVCTQNNVLLKENIVCRYHKQHILIKKIIENKNLGDIFCFTGSYCIEFNDKTNIRFNKNLGGGSLNDLGCYPVFLSRFLLQKEPKVVTCTLLWDKESEVDIAGVALLEFSHSLFTQITFGYNLFYQNTYSLSGSKGLITNGRAYSINEQMNPDINFFHGFDSQEKIIVEPDYQIKNAIESFCFDVIRKKSDNSCTIKEIQEIIHQATVLEGMRLSALSGKKIYLSEI